MWSHCGVTHTFLKLGNGKKVLSQGRAIDIPIITTSYLEKLDLTIRNLLYSMDVVMGMT